MFTYTDVINYPSSVQLIDDSDAPTATNFNTGPEGLANRTAWLHIQVDPLANLAALAAVNVTTLNGALLRVVSNVGDLIPGLYMYAASSAVTPQTPYVVSPASGTGQWVMVNPDRIQAASFTASGTAIAPAWAHSALITAVGGGGGGGCSRSADGFTRSISGAGGGGAAVYTVVSPVTPGASYAVSIGVGGAGATGTPAAGAAGSDTTFGALTKAQGALGGNSAPNSYTAAEYMMGGLTDRAASVPAYVYHNGSEVNLIFPPGTGGVGTNNPSSTFDGYRNGVGVNSGIFGVDSDGTGGGGGGGSAWPSGFGGNGGAGGVSTSAGLVGLPGMYGGGGGGGGGHAAVSSGGSAGGAGGNGALVVVWLR